jgi:hypothetical protein
MRRREFLGSATAWPVGGRAQQAERMRHIGMLVGINDPNVKAFQQELENQLGRSVSPCHRNCSLAPTR